MGHMAYSFSFHAKPLLFNIVLEFSVLKKQENKQKLEWNGKHKLLV
jgi:hypothetical protein